MGALARLALALAALAAAGCRKDALVVVVVDAQPAISGVAKLHVVGYVGERSDVHDEPVPPAYAALPAPAAAAPLSFGIRVDSTLGDSLALSVEARAADEHRLAIGRAAAPVRAGGESEVHVLIGPDDGTSDTTCVLDHSIFDNCTLAP